MLKSFSIRMHSFEQNFALRPVIGNTQFQYTQMYIVTERIIIVFRIAHSALLLQNMDYQLLQCWHTCQCWWIINMSHTLVGKMWIRTELPTIEWNECTCVWVRKECTFSDPCVGFKWQCVALRSWWVYLCLNRLVPNLVALILFCTFILPWVGTGPLWNQAVKQNSDVCKNTWWRNLLFIHNHFGTNIVSLTATLLYWLL